MAETQFLSKLDYNKITVPEQKYDSMLSNSSFTGSSKELTVEEIFDVEQYFSGSEKTKKFSNIDDFLKDLHE